MSATLIRAQGRAGTTDGYQQILSAEQESEVGMTFGVWTVSPGKTVQVGSAILETAVLAFSGTGSLMTAGRTLDFSRSEWLRTSPDVVHCCSGESVEVKNRGAKPAEVFVVQTPNPRRFAPRYYGPQDIQVEHRGKGILQDTCYRLVRLAFDDTNGPPESKLVLGEVVTFAGRWSSYPPHFHPQPEIYYYRFDPPNGYGYGELGEEVYKIRAGDLLAITGSRSHCQVAAPGYNMYYLWAVRHPEGNRYKGFTFEPEHAWTLQERSKP